MFKVFVVVHKPQHPFIFVLNCFDLGEWLGGSIPLPDMVPYRPAISFAAGAQSYWGSRQVGAPSSGCPLNGVSQGRETKTTSAWGPYLNDHRILIKGVAVHIATLARNKDQNLLPLTYYS